MVDEYIQEQLDKGYITPLSSPYTSQIFFVKKKDGTLRPVQDYQCLNKYTIPNQHPIPNLEDLTQRLSKARLFIALDIQTGYNNIRIKEGDQWKAAFKTPATCTNPPGHYELNVMPFGLCNAPETFQTFMNDVLQLWICTGWVLVYLDDILIATPDDLQLHRKIAHEVIEALTQNDLYLKLEKCFSNKERSLIWD